MSSPQSATSGDEDPGRLRNSQPEEEEEFDEEKEKASLALKQEKSREASKTISDSFATTLKALPKKTVKSAKLAQEELEKQVTSRFTGSKSSWKKGLSSKKHGDNDTIEMKSVKTVTGEEIIAIDNDSHQDGDEEEESRTVPGLGLSTMTDHCLSLEKLTEKLLISPINSKNPMENKGLNPTQVAGRLEIYGVNLERETSRVPVHVLFIECLTNLFNVLLFMSGALYLVIYAIEPLNDFESIWVGSTLILVGFINASIEFYENLKIDSILKSFQKMISSKTMAFRGGMLSGIDSKDLVPGDIIQLKPGDKVPADCVVFWVKELRIDGSNLTGESDPFVRLPQLNGVPDGTDPFECSHVVFSTDIVASGEGYALVVQTGRESIAGKIKKLTGKVKQRKSVLSKEISRFSKSIVILAVLTATIFFIWALARGRNFTYAITFGIGILIGWIPQGLPFTVTMLLGLSSRRMTEQKVLVKDFNGIETLGAITMLATDKTGTLTRNEMHVKDVWLNDAFWSVSDTNIPKGARHLKLDVSGLPQLLHVCVTCSRARFEGNAAVGTPKKIIGDSTEAGLLRFAAEKLKNLEQIDSMYPKLLELPFTSDSKSHLTIHRKSHPNGGLTLHMKGAPEKIWSLCSTIWINGKIVPITSDHTNNFEAALRTFGKKGNRLLACAILQLRGDKFPDNYKFDIEKKNFPLEGYSFLGILGLEDPPKDGVADTISKMKLAGIKVLMITGDNSGTAEAISRQVNLLTAENVIQIHSNLNLPIKFPKESNQGIVISGKMIDLFSEEDWYHALSYNEIIFARVLPSHKLEIVKHAQSLGHIVGVTGDGVNDSAALRQADLGIAMNMTGSDMSKESARMILLDDNFNSTLKGIFEGRLIFVNLKKAIKYSLSHIMAEILPYLLYVIVPIPLPITPTQILAVDLGFELLLTLSFAWEPAEDAEILMSLLPRRAVTAESAQHEYHNRVKRRQSNVRGSFDMLNSNNALNDFDESTDLLDNAEDEQTDLKKLNSRVKDRYGNYLNEAKSMGKTSYWKRYWKELKRYFTQSGGERLIDGEVLLWAYFEAGLIEFFACLSTYFAIFWFGFGVTANDARNGQIDGNVYWKPHSPELLLGDGSYLSGPLQFEALRQVQSGFYLSIFVTQLFNYFACKHRYTLYMNAQNWKNHRMWGMITGAIFLSTMVVYTPVTNAIFLTSLGLDPLYLLIPLSYGGFLYIYSIIRRFLLKSGIVKAPKGSHQRV